ncbi:hypothetical protein GGU11DRAFT_741891 [Lentinula aff. detonsa]|nr:hypothetical protein GGU11DRAFT_741891 [Lentinula aff. detonsa]
MFKSMLHDAKLRDPSWFVVNISRDFYPTQDNLAPDTAGSRDHSKIEHRLRQFHRRMLDSCLSAFELRLSNPGPAPNLFNRTSNITEVSSIFSLFVVLFVPEPGYEDAPVGLPLKKVINSALWIVRGRTKTSGHISLGNLQILLASCRSSPGASPLEGFQKLRSSQIACCIIHPVVICKTSSRMLIPVVESHPRLFTTEEDSRKLKDRVKALRVETDRIPEESRLDDYCNWWNSLSDFVGILEGRGEVIQRICEKLGVD